MNLPLITDAYEINPFRPDLPGEIQDLSPDLYQFLRELTESLRETHNWNQAGDTTYSWEILTKVSDSAQYRLGSVGRFFHPEFGILRARYCKFGRLIPTEYRSVPVGLSNGPNDPFWTVTNNLQFSDPSLVAGLMCAFVQPVSGQFGWVLTSGPNISEMVLSQPTKPKIFSQFVWQDEQRCGIGLGHTIATVVKPASLTEAGVGHDWIVSPGGCFIESYGASAPQVQAWIAEVTQSLYDQLGVIESILGAADLDAANQKFADITDSLESIASALTTLTSQINTEITSRQSQASDLQAQVTNEVGNRTTADAGLNSSISVLNSSVNSLLSSVIPAIQSQLDTATATNAVQDAGIATTTGVASAVSARVAGLAVDSEPVAVSVNSPWVDASGFAGVSYYRTFAGAVRIEGAISAAGGSSTTGVVLFTLPVGFRPAATHVFSVRTNGGTGRIDVDSAGQVIMQVGDTVLTSLNGVEFKAI